MSAKNGSDGDARHLDEHLSGVERVTGLGTLDACRRLMEAASAGGYALR
jgi:hypothetical protein